MFVNHEYVFTFILPVAIFFLVLSLTRMVSLSSMIGVLSASIMIFFFVDKTSGFIVFMLALFVIYRHRSNINRILKGTESKIGSAIKNR